MSIPSWLALKKEQKQTVILIGMWLAGSLFALYQFVLAPFLQNRTKSSSELDDLRSQIQKAEAAMQGESKLRQEYAAMMKTSQLDSEQYIVPIENPLSWVTERVYSNGRKVGVDVQSVAELGASDMGWTALIKAERTFKPYAVRIVTECGYAQLLDFIRALEGSNPYLCVSGITISANDMNVSRHVINLVVEWPMWGRRVEFGLAKQKKPAENAAE
jgi:hypothetical protein